MCGKRNVLESVANVVTNVATLGAVGVSADGKVNLDSGVVSHGIGSAVASVGQGLKEITGAQAAEDALNLQKEQFASEKTAALKDREDAKQQAAIDDMTKSKLAGSLKNSKSSSSQQSRYSSKFSTTGSDERDFLGL